MLDLHDREWLAIPLSSVFSIKSTSSGIDKNKLIYQSGKYPYVTRTDTNNGINDFICEQPFYGMDTGNCITVGLDTQTAFYQENSFYTGQNILEEKAPEFEIINPQKYRVDYENNVVKLPQSIKDQYKYILVEYEDCDDYYYWFMNYHRQLVDLEKVSNIYLDTDYSNALGAVTIYGIPEDSILRKDQFYALPNRFITSSIDYCASKYEEIPDSAYTIFSSNRVVIDSEIREKYRYLIIDYLKKDSYAINEEYENYKIEISTDEDKVKILYDANEYDVTNPYKGLLVSTDTVIKDDFIVLRKDRKL